MLTVEEYLHDLKGKGFQLLDDAIGFIYFGRHYTNASDEIIITAIEVTLKAQKTFDGSFYISLLETLIAHQLKTRRDALKFIKENDLVAI